MVSAGTRVRERCRRSRDCNGSEEVWAVGYCVSEIIFWIIVTKKKPPRRRTAGVGGRAPAELVERTAQVVVRVELRGEAEDGVAIVAVERGVDLADHRGLGEREAHLGVRRVEQRGRGGAEQVAACAVEVGAALEGERAQEAGTAEARVAGGRAEDALHGLG